MTRILHVSHTEIPRDSRILKELAALATLPDVLLAGLGIKGTEAGMGSSQVEGVPVETLELRARRLPRKLRGALVGLEMTLRLVLRGLRYKPDVIHCHDTLALPAAALLKVLCRARLVYDAHELESRKNAQSRLHSWITLMCERSCWGLIDLLVSVSPAIIEWYKKNLGDKAGALVLNSPVYDPQSRRPRGPVRQPGYFHRRYGLPDDALVFVYLGYLVRGRGIETCLDAFGRSGAGAHVVFIGSGDLSGMIKERAVHSSNIHLHEPLPHAEIVGVVQAADYGLCFIENVSLSDYLCLPNKLFEYAFAGLPVLASNFPEMKRVIERYSLGICCEPTAEGVRDAIRATTSAPPRGDTGGDLAELSWDSQAASLLQAYRRMLGRPG